MCGKSLEFLPLYFFEVWLGKIYEKKFGKKCWENDNLVVEGGMKKLRLITMAALMLLIVVACDGQGLYEGGEKLCVASWNVQNLFDAKEDGAEYDEYKAASGWDNVAYKKRLENVGTVISYLPRAKDYILVLNEVESTDVVEDIVKLAKVSGLGIRWYACTSEENSAIQTAVVSSVPISEAHIHAVGDGLRPVLEVRFETTRGLVVVFAVHFKSNVGGVAETAEARAMAASVVADVARQVEQENPGCLMLVCGDMNDECWAKDGVMRDGGPLPVSSGFGRRLWNCFWMDERYGLWPSGSYLYKDVWCCYDNILISQAGLDGSGLEFAEAGVIFKGILKTADGKPNKWQRDLLKGVSDHLPVFAVFE